MQFEIKKQKYPSKTGINLAMRENHTRSIVTMTAGLLVIALLSGMVARVGVADQFIRLDQAEGRYQEIADTLKQQEEELSDFDAVELDYRTHQLDWDRDEEEERVFVDRLELLTLIEEELMSCGTVKAFQIGGEFVTAQMADMNLTEISKMFESLQKSPYVAQTSLDIAQTENEAAGRDDLEFSVTILLSDGAEEEEE